MEDFYCETSNFAIYLDPERHISVTLSRWSYYSNQKGS